MRKIILLKICRHRGLSELSENEQNRLIIVEPLVIPQFGMKPTWVVYYTFLLSLWSYRAFPRHRQRGTTTSHVTSAETKKPPTPTPPGPPLKIVTDLSAGCGRSVFTPYLSGRTRAFSLSDGENVQVRPP
ncbi:hypothetical protein CEXT_253991 [Caerostris extrusa]|uniref:Uncharacterized protein n=1 Tax=Caerostris extrusa TaxID=172846 RepID=A0AAV4NFV2_CAEEX|nr:hypothetical protein CEXT_253991 [Caerostris extrusa]